MAESREYSRDGIARTAQAIRENARRNGHSMTTDESIQRVRKAIRNTPTNTRRE